MCNIVCAMCGLMSDNYLAWEEHVAEVALKEDSDHANLLAVKINSNGDKVNNKLPIKFLYKLKCSFYILGYPRKLSREYLQEMAMS